MSRSLVVCLICLSVTPAFADARLPAIFSDHMVLQRGHDVPVWGWADAKESVTVTVAGQEQKTVADENGKWLVRFSALKSTAPTSLTVSAGNTIVVHDVLIGEVWLGSGQSNMAMTVSRCQNFESEKSQADLPKIRMFVERSGTSETKRDDAKGTWVVCSPGSVGGFSGTLYFFGQQIHQKLNVPVGLINSSVGGTPIESWIDGDTQRKSVELRPLIQKLTQKPSQELLKQEAENYQAQLLKWKQRAKSAKEAGKNPPRRPRDPAETRKRKRDIGGLFNGKISPLIPYAIRGAIWYQGEANSTPEKAAYYRHHLPLLINDWRSRWGYEFPFAWAQLPNYIGNGRDWPTVRQGMLETLRLPKTGMGINIDIGDSKDIHPKNKQDVGLRLSYWALGTVYDQEVPAISGPIPSGNRVDGDTIWIDFQYASGLKTSDGSSVTGFEIQDQEGTWHPASATIKDTSVGVNHSGVSSPKAARYAWSNDPECNLVNGAGLPATPMTTEQR